MKILDFGEAPATPQLSLGHGAWGIGHRASGMGHRASGMGHGAWGIGHGAWRIGHTSPRDRTAIVGIDRSLSEV